jgi:hypothetical protein
VTYTPKWERLSETLDSISNSAAISREQAAADLCRALSDGDIDIRVTLAKHAFRLQTSSDVVFRSDLQIPSLLNPSDFDWQRSRPNKPWSVSKRSPRYGGPWELAWIEVSKADVTRKFSISEVGAAQTGAKAPSKAKKKRATPKLDAANKALAELYEQNIPAHELNDRLVNRTIEHAKKKYKLDVSRDTVLRAAGRRK